MINYVIKLKSPSGDDHSIDAYARFRLFPQALSQVRGKAEITGGGGGGVEQIGLLKPFPRSKYIRR